MKEFQYIIKDTLGIHARPAGMLAKLAKGYESEIQIIKGERMVSATQLLMLMSLAVKQGDEVTVRITGVDENNAFEGVQAFFHENL